MVAPLTLEDVQAFDPEADATLVTAMIASVWARAQRVAPCLKVDATLTDPDDAEVVRTILRGVIMRWLDTGSGAVTQRQAGDYQETLRDFGGGLLRPDEIKDLQGFCTGVQTQAATTIRTRPDYGYQVHHALWCSTRFSNNTDVPTLCDCGAELTWDGFPLWPSDGRVGP